MRRLLAMFYLIVSSFVFVLPAQSQPINPRDITAHLIGHAHIDLSWCWLWEETVHDIAVNTFKGMLTQMEKAPGLTFAQSQPALYDAIEKTYPDLFKAIEAKIRQGTWIPVGGMWAEPDLNMPDGESLVRQLLYGKGYFQEKFGKDVKVGWNPDSFGHNGQLPQIYAKSGIRYYVFTRCGPEKTPLFWWEGIDGSKILDYVPSAGPAFGYLTDLSQGLRNPLMEVSKYTPARDFLILYGVGDHGGGPRDSDVQAYEKYRLDPSHPQMKYADPESYFKQIETSGISLPSIKGELNFTFPACYTTQARTKKNNRRGESLLLTAEKFSTLAASSGYRDYYPERDMDEAWKIVMRNQFHDIICGSCIGPAYDEAEKFYREAFRRGERALDFSLESIMDRIDTSGEGIPVIVFNPLFWERTDPIVVDVLMPAEAKNLMVLNPQGTEIPFQVVQTAAEKEQTRYRLLFMAEKVPSFGYSLYRVKESKKGGKFTTPLHVSRNRMENEFFRVTIDPFTGWMKSIVDKRSGREILAGAGNILQAIADEPEIMSAWELGLKKTIGTIGENGSQIEVVEAGPIRAILRIKNSFRRSRFEQDIVLMAGSPRIDFRLKLDWQERNVMIKAAFPVTAKNQSADFEIPFGSVSRPVDGTEVPALKWIDLSDESGQFGVSILNDCKYGFDVRESTMRMSVIHGATYPDPEADRGSHELAYSLFPHAGTWREAGTVRRGYELNNPLIPRIAMAHAGKMGPVHSFIQAEPGNVVVSTLKKEKGYYNRSLILRLYESSGRKTEASVTFPWSVTAMETDLMENPSKEVQVSGNRISLSFKPFEIKTLKIIRKET